jgi:hypothetical protein
MHGQKNIKSYTKFHENSTHSLVADAMPRKEGRTDGQTEEHVYRTRCSVLLRKEHVGNNRNCMSKH